MLAGGRGFEPRLTGPEPVVLPLYDPPAGLINLAISGQKSRKTSGSFCPYFSLPRSQREALQDPFNLKGCCAENRGPQGERTPIFQKSFGFDTPP